MGQFDRLVAFSRAVARIRQLRREPADKAVPELHRLLRDPETSHKLIVPVLLALRRFGPAAAVVLPLVEKYTRPEEAEKVRKVARSVLANIRGK